MCCNQLPSKLTEVHPLPKIIRNVIKKFNYIIATKKESSTKQTWRAKIFKSKRLSASFSSNTYKLWEFMLKAHFLNFQNLDMKSIIRINANMHTKSLTPGMIHGNCLINANHNYFMIYYINSKWLRLSSIKLQFCKIK